MFKTRISTVFKTIFIWVVEISEVYIEYTIFVDIVMLLYAGLVTKNIFLVLVPLLITFVVYLVISFMRKKGILCLKNKREYSRKATILFMIGLLCFAVSFAGKYIYRRPSVAEVNKVCDYMYANEMWENRKMLDTLHAVSAPRLQEMSAAVTVMDFAVNVASEYSEMYAQYNGSTELSKEEKQMYEEFVNEKRIQLEQIQQSVELGVQHSKYQSIGSIVFALAGAVIISFGKRFEVLKNMA